MEERENQKKDALGNRFNFIREFARYNLNDMPIYYIIPNKLILYSNFQDFIKPVIRFTDFSDKLDDEFRIYIYQIVGHHFCIPTSHLFDNYYLVNFMKHLNLKKYPIGNEIRPINMLADIDFTFRFLNEK